MEATDVRSTTFKAASAVAVVMLAACGGAQESTAAESSTGAELAAYEGPIASTDVEHGKELFDALCSDCHPDGGEDVGPSLVADPHTPPQLRKQIREGSGRMKPFSEKRLGPQDLEDVLAYLASINAVK